MTNHIDYDHELNIGVTAVRKASEVCRIIQHGLEFDDKLQKQDLSPVTVADFASQAIICAVLQAHSSVQPVMAEESAAELRKPERTPLRAKVVEHVRNALDQEVAESEALGWIDRGAWRPNGGTTTYWTLDPVDGTKGFVRGDHYSIALALIDNGKVILGILSCPKLPGPDGSIGALAAAARGRGARLFSLADEGSSIALHVADVHDMSQARLCESVEPSHGDQSVSSQITARLGISVAPLRIDSQVKYAVLASGQASIYIRFPKRQDYVEKVWDHAAGSIILEESGGIVTDIAGKALDFTRGESLSANRGIVAASAAIHDKVLAAVRAYPFAGVSACQHDDGQLIR